MKMKIVHLGESLLSGLGLISLLIGAYYTLNPADNDRISFSIFVLLGLMIGAIWFVINGYLIVGYLKRSILVTSNAFDTQITVLFGDVFGQTGLKAISVNEYFDSAVDGKHVATNTLHGSMLTRFWPGNVSDWDDQVTKELEGIASIQSITARNQPGKKKKYEIGTTVSVSAKNEHFLCVALSKTDTNSLQASASSDDLHHAMRGLLSKARTECGDKTLNIPLLGSGLARTGIKPNIIVDLIMLAIFEESKKQKITGKIRVVLPKEMRNRIDLYAIQRDWS